ncbi:hypothetical protein Aspvir_003748 [Aspergillus viridinutans]|uniref:Uncharacterized protein n=1 Tax=Aspergillus viridinutans TaxID=75553 RepID=A0A9P3BTN2_ASPVI|nr:uncharacterized protein Aspvir_003748 [Aspergillus viridinutans]GIJ99745.1 hypothetical protein Aspvir_003748 [Aspergillus viridinutans]
MNPDHVTDGEKKNVEVKNVEVNDGYSDAAKKDPSRRNKEQKEPSLKITIHLDLVAEVDIKIKAQLYGDVVIGLL